MAVKSSYGVKGGLCLCLQAGGTSSRMGTDKALKPFCGESLIGWVLRRLLLEHLALQIDTIIVTTNHPEAYHFLVEQYHPKLMLAKDLVSGMGALGGLYTALRTSRSEITAVVACDLPFADGEILVTGYELLSRENWDGFVPRTQAGLEPLHALYRTQVCLPFVEETLASGQRKVTAWFSKARIYLYDVEEREPSPFFNVNTPAEFTQAEIWANRYRVIPNGR
jgi:molybdopterin-guanine dinucleotide biosynthesis protein A